MSIQSFTQIFKEMGPEDRAALATLKAEEEKRTERPLSIRDIIEATTPGFDTPTYLKG